MKVTEGGSTAVKERENLTPWEQESCLPEYPACYGDVSKWFEVSGDVDDFIFFDGDEKSISER